jgi:hypothetical protein
VTGPDPVGGREAEIEAVARAIYDTQENVIAWDSETLGDWRREYEREKARAAIAALEALRSSGPAAQPTTEEREAYMRGYRAAKAGLTPKPEGESGSAAQNQEETLLWQAREALRFTREYVGEDTLPAIEGWSWYDATVAIDRYLAARSPQDGRPPSPKKPGCIRTGPARA